MSNGIGKASLSKGFLGANGSELSPNLEGDTTNPESLEIDILPISQYEGIQVFTSSILEEVLNDSLDVIRGFIRQNYNSKPRKNNSTPLYFLECRIIFSWFILVYLIV